MLYEDDAVVALNKPAGLPAVPVKGSDTPSAWSLLSAELKPRRQRAFVVHRIDRFTLLGFCSLQKPHGIETHSFDSFSATVR